MSAPCIYDDLKNADLGEKIVQLQQHNEKLLEHVQSLENDIGKLCTELTQMKVAKDGLKRNISELFNTAKLEIQRKDRMIAELRRELEDLLFRRGNRHVHNKRIEEIQSDRPSAKRDREEPGSESETSKRLKHESSPSKGNEIPRSTHKTEPVQRGNSREPLPKYVSGRNSSNRSSSNSPVRNEDKGNRTKNRQREHSRHKSKGDRIRNRSSERGRSRSKDRNRSSYKNKISSKYRDRERDVSKDGSQNAVKSKERSEFRSSAQIPKSGYIKKAPNYSDRSDKNDTDIFSSRLKEVKEVKNHSKPKINLNNSKLDPKKSKNVLKSNVPSKISNKSDVAPLEIKAEEPSNNIRQESNSLAPDDGKIDADIIIKREEGDDIANPNRNTSELQEVNAKIDIVKVEDSDSSMHHSNIINSVSTINGQVVEEDLQMTIDPEIKLEHEEIMIKEEPPSVPELCNISTRERSLSTRRRRRCIIKIVN